MTGQMLQLEILFDTQTDNLVFAGHKRLSISINPLESFDLLFHVIPLATGFIQLPVLVIKFSQVEKIHSKKQSLYVKP